jgi:hypothetical protein
MYTTRDRPSRIASVVLLAFLAALALVLAATVFAVVRGIGLWRQAKRTGGAFSAELTLFEQRSARAERLLAETDRSSRELGLALERLRMSRARLQVLVDALDRAQRRVHWLRAFVPIR